MDKISILIAGFGSIGRRHYKNLKKLGYSKFSFYRTNEGTIQDIVSTEIISKIQNLGMYIKKY